MGLVIRNVFDGTPNRCILYIRSHLNIRLLSESPVVEPVSTFGRIIGIKIAPSRLLITKIYRLTCIIVLSQHGPENPKSSYSVTVEFVI